MKTAPFNQKDPSKTKTPGGLPIGKTGGFDPDNKKGGDNKKAASKKAKK